MPGDKRHWENRYKSNSVNGLSWFQDSPEPSLSLIRKYATRADPVIDVGAGASNLVDHLLDGGWSDVTLLDWAESALDVTVKRLGNRAVEVARLISDVTQLKPDRTFRVWHDRAVFHFLVEEAERQAYKKALLQSLVPRGLFVLGTFAPSGPQRCSGLPIRQWDTPLVLKEWGDEFELLEGRLHQHTTPHGGTQLFSWHVLCRK